VCDVTLMVGSGTTIRKPGHGMAWHGMAWMHHKRPGVTSRG